MHYLFYIALVASLCLFGENSSYQVLSRIDMWGWSWIVSHCSNYLFALFLLSGILLPITGNRWHARLFVLLPIFLVVNRILYGLSPHTVTSVYEAFPTLYSFNKLMGDIFFVLLMGILLLGGFTLHKVKYGKPFKVVLIAFFPLLFATYIVIFNPIYIDDFQHNYYQLTEEEKGEIIPLFERQIDANSNQLVMIFSSGCYYCAQHSPVMNVSVERVEKLGRYKAFVQGTDEDVKFFVETSGLQIELGKLTDENILQLSRGTFPTYYLLIDGEVYLYQGEEMSYKALDFIERKLTSNNP